MAKCEICGREFSTASALAQHMKDKHGQEGQRPAGSTEARRETTKAGRSKQRSLRRRNRHPVAIGIAAVAIAVGLGLYIIVAPNFIPTPVPCLGGTGENYIHVHPYIRINIEGTNVPIPAQIGFLKAGACIEEIHTHDTSGIIHIELGTGDVNSNFTLADFFSVWNATYSTVSFNGTSHPVLFANGNILGYRTDTTHKVVVLVDNISVTNGAGVPIEQLDYCGSSSVQPGPPPLNTPCYPTDATDSTTGAPCSSTSTTCSIGNPYWQGTTTYPYKTGHTIVIEYVKS